MISYCAERAICIFDDGRLALARELQRHVLMAEDHGSGCSVSAAIQAKVAPLWRSRVASGHVASYAVHRDIAVGQHAVRLRQPCKATPSRGVAGMWPHNVFVHVLHRTNPPSGLVHGLMMHDPWGSPRLRFRGVNANEKIDSDHGASRICGGGGGSPCTSVTHAVQ